MNMLKDGAEFLSGQLHANAAELIVYARGVTEIELTAIVGRMEGAQHTTDDFITDGDQVDFIIQAADLVIATVQIDPEMGDEIRMERGSKTFAYKLTRDALDQLFRRCDEHGFDIRVHTVCKGEYTE